MLVRDGIRRMYGAEPEDCFYYLTLYNENYVQPPMPEGVEDGIVRGHVPLPRRAEPSARTARRSSRAVRWCCRRSRRSRCSPSTTTSRADVWSVTGWKQLRDDALDVRAVEPAAPDRAAAHAVRHRAARRHRRARSSR